MGNLNSSQSAVVGYQLSVANHDDVVLFLDRADCVLRHTSRPNAVVMINANPLVQAYPGVTELASKGNPQFKI